jgi:hypothetical protein
MPNEPQDPNVEEQLNNPPEEVTNDSAEGAKEGESKEAPAVTPAAVEFASRYLGKTAGQKKGAKKEDEAPSEKPEKPKKPAKKKPAEPQPQGIDEEKLGRAVGESVAKAMAAKEVQKKSEPEPPKGDPAEERKLKILRQMAEAWPDRYKGLAETYASSMEELRSYARKWELEHPGKKFDQDDEEHAEFIDALESRIEYDQDDYAEAIADLKLKEKMPKEDKSQVEDLNRRLGEFERKEKIRESQQQIAKTSAETGNSYWKSLSQQMKDDNLKDIVREDGTIDLEMLKQMQEQDPDRTAIMLRAAEAAENHAAITYLLENGLVDFDPINNPAHKYLSDFALKSEQRMLKRDLESQLDSEGRPFVTREKWMKLSLTEREKVWTFSAEDLNFLVATDFAKRASDHIKAEEERFERRAKARGLLQTPEPTLKEPTSHPIRMIPKHRPQVPPAQVERIQKPQSPSIPAVPRVAPASIRNSGTPKNPLVAFAQRAIRGR